MLPTIMNNSIKTNILNWIHHISIPRDELGRFSVCPYAKGSEYDVIETDGSDINPPPWDFELLIYVLPDSWSEDELIELATEYNKIYNSLIFLPDHKDRDTFINGVKTNNGQHNLLLCQWRDNLNKARTKLGNTTYYSFWNDEYLKEILGT